MLLNMMQKGNRNWETLVGSYQADYVRKIVTNDGSVYIAGATSGPSTTFSYIYDSDLHGFNGIPHVSRK